MNKQIRAGFAVAIICIIVSGCGGGGSSSNNRATTYTPVILSPLSGRGIAINNNGTVLCTSYDSCFTLDSRSRIVTDIPVAEYTTMYDINDQGQIVGERAEHAFIMQPNGQVRELAQMPDTIASIALGINNQGTIVGMCGQRIYGNLHNAKTVIWSADGTVRKLDLLPGYAGGDAIDINDAGVIVGCMESASDDFGRLLHAVKWNQDGRVFDIGSTSGEWSAAYSINNTGQIVGVSNSISGSLCAVKWGPSGQITAMDMLPGYVTSTPMDINDQGWAVGYVENHSENFYTTKAVCWTPEGRIIDLGAGLAGPSKATAINNSGVIVGSVSPYDHEQVAMWIPSH